MRLCKKEIVNLFAEDYPKDYPEPETVVSVLKLGYKVKDMPVKMKERQSGTSSISLKKAVYYMIKVPLACLFAAIRKKM